MGSSFEGSGPEEPVVCTAATAAAIREGFTVRSVFDGGRIIGFATVSRRISGVTAGYVQPVCLQISEEYRRQGIGRRLRMQTVVQDVFSEEGLTELFCPSDV